jgi:hypothetical protein
MSYKVKIGGVEYEVSDPPPWVEAHLDSLRSDQQPWVIPLVLPDDEG